MKTIHEDLSKVINHLEVICERMNSLRIEMEIARPRVRVDDYFKCILASARIREAIEILGNMINETESVSSTT